MGLWQSNFKLTSGTSLHPAVPAAATDVPENTAQQFAGGSIHVLSCHCPAPSDVFTLKSLANEARGGTRNTTTREENIQNIDFI